jgi:hypothetical protein
MPAGPCPSIFNPSNDGLLTMHNQPSDRNVYKTTIGTAQESHKGFIEREHSSTVYIKSYAAAPESYNTFTEAGNASSGYRDTFTTSRNRHDGIVEADNVSESSTAMTYSYSEDESSGEIQQKPTSKVCKS